MSKYELLAPAGDLEKLKFALLYEEFMKGSGLKCRQLGQIWKKAAVTVFSRSEFLRL